MSLTFIIPVRHPASVANWGPLKALMAETVRSIAAQSHDDWTCVIAAQRGTDLPPLPKGFHVAVTDIRRPDMPDIQRDREGYYRGVREDKGARILAALVEAQPQGHVMVVDFDDLVHRDLAGLAARHPDANGWYFDSGWLYSGGRLASLYPEAFYRHCGTSHIVHARLLKVPATVVEADLDYVSRALGSHIFIHDDLEAEGTPLAPLPFVGAVYRIGHSEATMRGVSLQRRIGKKVLRSPRTLVSQMKSLRRVGPAMRRDYFGAAG